MQKYISTIKDFLAKQNQGVRIALTLLLIAMAAYFTYPAAELVFSNTSGASAEATKPKKMLPIYSVDTPDKKIAISFDAAWGADDTDHLLQILKDEDIRATFFLCGYWVDKYPDEVKKIHASGHDIGNHGNTHAHGSQISKDKNKEEILKAHEKIKNLLGYEMTLFRPPFGEYNNDVIQAASELNYYTIQWDIDTLDIKAEVPNTLVHTITDENKSR